MTCGSRDGATANPAHPSRFVPAEFGAGRRDVEQMTRLVFLGIRGFVALHEHHVVELQALDLADVGDVDARFERKVLVGDAPDVRRLGLLGSVFRRDPLHDILTGGVIRALRRVSYRGGVLGVILRLGGDLG